MRGPDLELDHPRLETVVKLCAPDETDPRWEITAATTTGNLLDFDGSDGARMISTVGELLDEPTVVAQVSLTLWVPR